MSIINNIFHTPTDISYSLSVNTTLRSSCPPSEILLQTEVKTIRSLCCCCMKVKVTRGHHREDGGRKSVAEGDVCPTSGQSVFFSQLHPSFHWLPPPFSPSLDQTGWLSWSWGWSSKWCWGQGEPRTMMLLVLDAWIILVFYPMLSL